MKKQYDTIPAHLVVAFFLVLLAPVHFLSGQALAWDSGDLSNRMSRAISLKDTFFLRSDLLTDALSENMSLFDGTASLQGVWYNGYTLKTNFGNQSGTLGRVYGDVFAGVTGKRFSVLFGTGGYRYGVFLTGINLAVPANDPAGPPSVTDFTGTQYFQDIFSSTVLMPGAGALSLFMTMNREFSPAAGVVHLANPDSVSYCLGGKVQVLGAFEGDLMCTPSLAFVSAGGSFDPLRLVFLAVSGLPPSGVSVRSGIKWKNFSDGSFEWSRFVYPASITFGSKNTCFLTAGVSLCSQELQKTLGTPVRSLWGESGLRLTPQVHLSGGVSWFADPRIANFSDSGKQSVPGFTASLSYSPSALYRLEMGVRYNYYSDLEDLIETVNRNVYYLNLTCLLPTLFHF